MFFSNDTATSTSPAMDPHAPPSPLAPAIPHPLSTPPDGRGGSSVLSDHRSSNLLLSPILTDQEDGVESVEEDGNGEREAFVNRDNSGSMHVASGIEGRGTRTNIGAIEEDRTMLSIRKSCSSSRNKRPHASTVTDTDPNTDRDSHPSWPLTLAHPLKKARYSH